MAHAYRNAKLLVAVDIFVLIVLALISPRPAPQVGVSQPLVPSFQLTIGFALLAATSARWAGQHRATQATQIGFAILCYLAIVAGTFAYMALWVTIGAPPGESILDVIAPSLSSVGDPVSDVVMALFVLLWDGNMAWIGVVEYGRRHRTAGSDERLSSLKALRRRPRRQRQQPARPRRPGFPSHGFGETTAGRGLRSRNLTADGRMRGSIPSHSGSPCHGGG